MQTKTSTAVEIIKLAGEKDVKYVFNQLVDIDGTIRGKGMPIGQIENVAKNGSGFAGGSIPCSGHGQDRGDLICMPDLSTFVRLPWQRDCGRVMGNLYYEGKPHPCCPRGNLKRITDMAAKEGYIFNVGFEPEHFLVTTDVDGKRHRWNENVDTVPLPGYIFENICPALPYLLAMVDALDELGYELYAFDHEDANSQFEMNFKYAEATQTADRLTLFRLMAKQFAKQKLGATATFQPKPFDDLTGTGCHMHFSLADVSTQENVFIDMNDPTGHELSKLAHHFLGGLFAHAAALRAVSNPTMQCYDRLSVTKANACASGINWVPAGVPTWGGNDRTMWIRVSEPGNCEDRSVSGACNPYLVIAAHLAAGLDGIKKEIDPGEPCRGSAFKQTEGTPFPITLSDALNALEKDAVVCDALGPIAPLFVSQKRKEIAAWPDFKQNKVAPVVEYFKYL